MKKNRASLLILPLAIGITVGLVRPTLSATPRTLSPIKTLSDQIASDVETALLRNTTAQSQEQWSSSGYTPKDIFEHVAAFGATEGWEALCQKLMTLSPQNLALFEDELEKSEHEDFLDCREEALEIVQRFWAQGQTELAMIHDLSPDISASLATEKSFTLAHNRTLPKANFKKFPEVKVVEVDASSGPIFERGNLKAGEIALTFDDGPHPSRSMRIVEILDQAGIRATYFQIGQNAKTYPQISRDISNHGHTVGSHTWSHPNLPKKPLKEAEKDILKGRASVAEAAGVEIPFFRFPYGAKNEALKNMVRAHQMAMFFWNMDSLDWKIRDPKALFENILAELNREKGGILLFHDVHEQTIIVLPHLIEELQKRGYTPAVFVPKR